MKKVGIAGTGGIGGNVAMCLVRSGVTRLKIIDFDCVEISNLNRQFFFHDQVGQPKVRALAENLNRIQPGLEIEALQLKLNQTNMKSIFKDCHIIVEGFDGPVEKKLLLETMADQHKPIVAASGVAGRCIDTIRTRQMGNCTIVGDFSTDCRNTALCGAKVITIAAMMSAVILERGGFYE